MQHREETSCRRRSTRLRYLEERGEEKGRQEVGRHREDGRKEEGGRIKHSS